VLNLKTPDAIMAMKMCRDNSQSSYNEHHPLKEHLYRFVEENFNEDKGYEIAFLGTGKNPNYSKEASYRLRDRKNINIKAIDPEIETVLEDPENLERIPKKYQEHYNEIFAGQAERNDISLIDELIENNKKSLEADFIGIEICSHQNVDHVDKYKEALSDDYKIKAGEKSIIGYKGRLPDSDLRHLF